MCRHGGDGGDDAWSGHVTWLGVSFLLSFFPQKDPSFQCRRTRLCLQQMTVTRCYVLRTSLLEENWTRQTSQTYFFPSNEPKNKSGGGRATVPVVQVATRNINNMILKATIEVDNAPERIAFYRSLSRD